MNKRIKELALEARIAYYSKNSAYEGSDEGLSVIPSTQSLEKFAELLIREAAQFVSGSAEVYTQAEQDACVRAAIGLKKYFGVEE